MTLRINDIIAEIEQVAPLSLQEEYDNCGLLVGNPETVCTGALICLDVSPEIVSEAVEKGCNLIIAHHPVIFKGLKRLNGSSLVEQTAIEAIRNNMAIYASHTAMDNAPGGVSAKMASMLRLQKCTVLDPQNDMNLKLAVYVPESHISSVSEGLFSAGAGNIGSYECCSFRNEGLGTFLPLPEANPFVGQTGNLHTEKEVKLEVLLPAHLKGKITSALLSSHPYEEPAFEFYKVSTGVDRLTGCGIFGELPQEMKVNEFVKFVKQTFNAEVARCSRVNENFTIRKIALCGGSGGFLIGKAVSKGADAIITADVKYHDFVDYENRILIVDIGHFETEVCITSIFYEIISKKFPNFALRYANHTHNPVIYM